MDIGNVISQTRDHGRESILMSLGITQLNGNRAVKVMGSLRPREFDSTNGNLALRPWTSLIPGCVLMQCLQANLDLLHESAAKPIG